MNAALSTIAIAGVAALAIGFFFSGAHWQASRDSEALSAANANGAVCESALTSKGDAVKEIQRQLDDLRGRHARALKDSERTLAERDAEIAVLTATANEKTTIIRKAAHDDAECASLARLPVCAAIARELWPSSTAADRHAN